MGEEEEQAEMTAPQATEMGQGQRLPSCGKTGSPDDCRPMHRARRRCWKETATCLKAGKSRCIVSVQANSGSERGASRNVPQRQKKYVQAVQNAWQRGQKVQRRDQYPLQRSNSVHRRRTGSEPKGPAEAKKTTATGDK